MGNPISKTAYYTLACRFWDAEAPKPVCNDNFAHVFMNEESRAIGEQFKSFSKPNASISTRHRIIDDHLRAALAKNPKLLVLNIGCGFDTRAFRHNGGRWVEIDEPELIEHKDSKLPAQDAKNELSRISIDFAKDSLKEKLAPFKTEEPVAVILEGVCMYLEQEEERGMFTTLRELFPRHTVYCDLMTNTFFTKYSHDLHEQIKTLGTRFKGMVEKPEELLLGLGYQSAGRTSATLRSAEFGAISVPAFVIRYFLGKLRDGLCVWVFEYSGG